MSSPSPSRSNPNGLPTSSVAHLAACLDSVSLESDASFIGGFKAFTEHRTARQRAVGEYTHPPAATPLETRVSSHPGAVPISLQPGAGRYAGEHQAAVSSSSQFMEPFGAVSPTIHMPMPSIPGDYSLTMAYARSAIPASNNYTILPQIPKPDNDKTPPRFYREQSTPPSTTHPSQPIVTRARSSSSPPSPASSTRSTSSSTTVQCGGTTKAGKRCSRAVKSPPPLSFFAPVSSEPVERFCFQHVKEINSQSGFYSHKAQAGWVTFAEWIPHYLHSDTQAALRIEMEKAASKADEPGYIYAYEIRDDASQSLQIKVGRAVKLTKRLDQWSKQCTSKEVILRGWWPGKVEDDGDSNNVSLLRGKVIPGEKGPFCHRLERLVHLELADLAIHAPYLEAGFPKAVKESKDTKSSGTTSAPSTPGRSPGRSPKPSKVRMPGGEPCKDCGSIHKEIFTLQRVPKGMYKNMEWERLVKPVIERWGSFVGQYV